MSSATNLTLPFPKATETSLRDSLKVFRDEETIEHPVERLIKKQKENREMNKLTMIRNMYGSALATRMHIEKQIIQKNPRLPPLTSSNISLEAYFGTLDQMTIESYLGLDENCPDIPIETHLQMESMLKC